MGVKIRQRGDSYEIDVHWRGQRRRVAAKTEKIADAVALQIERLIMRAELAGGNVSIDELIAEPQPRPRPTGPTVGAYAKDWMQFNSKANGWKRSTRQNYESIVSNHIRPEWKDVPLEDVSRMSVKHWLLGIAATRKPKTVRNIYRTLSSIMSAAFDDGLVGANPILRMGRVLPKVRQGHERPRAWTADELAAILDAAKEIDLEHYPLYAQLAKTGQRIGEAIATQWIDVDFVNDGLRIDRTWVRGELSDTKGRQFRTIGMSIQMATTHPPLHKILRRLQTNRKRHTLQRGWKSLPIWAHPSADGSKPIDADDLRDRFWSKVIKKAGVPNYGFHGFRHTFATHLLLAGVPMFRVSRMLGHSSVAITADIYGWVLPETGERRAVSAVPEDVTES